MRKLIIVSTFDFSLVFTQSWQRGYGYEMRKQLGFYLPRVLFFRSKAGVTILRPAVDQKKFEYQLTKHIKKDSNYLPSRLHQFQEYLQPLKAYENSFKNNWQYAKKLFILSSQLLPIYVVVHWMYRSKPLNKFTNKQTKQARLASEGYYDRVDRIWKRIYLAKVKDRPGYKPYSNAISYREFSNLVRSRRFPPLKKLMARSVNFFLYKNVFMEGYLDPVKLSKRYGFIYPQARLTKQNEALGTPAFSGKVRGRAVIVEGKQDLYKVKVGDILICLMTSPDFVPAIKKSKALVTDHGGGIMMHSAIIARELKKPCIIGTKIATQVFKDGDLVEVDANHGIVKILKRAKSKY